MSDILIENLVKQYGHGETTVTAVGGIDLQIRSGEFISIMGESGSGKSTLLAMMGGLSRPTRGRYVVDGLDVYALTQEQRADFRREYLGFVFQSFHLLPYLTVEENVMLPLAALRMKAKEKQARAREALERVGMASKKDRLPGSISGGEQERVTVARAVVNHPPILLADEPTGNLDTRNSLAVMGLFRTLNREGTTIVMVTHSEECAASAERTLRVSDGKIVMDPTVRNGVLRQTAAC